MKTNLIQIETTNADDFQNEMATKVVAKITSIWGHPQTNNSEIILSRQEAADILKISLVTLWDLTRKDRIPAFKIGSKIRYRKIDVLNALTQKNQF